jgi:N-acetylglucosaminyl-diphospho-decaprenol L-rhamnosyltransferase
MERPSLIAMDVVIVHYHAAAGVREAVEALRADARASNLPIHIVVADNGSTPDERALLDSLRVTLIAIGRNAGYAGAINAAMQHTRSDFIVVMNEDVLVLPGCLRELRTALASGAAVAGPKFYWDRDCTLLLPCTEERTRRNELAKAAGRRSLEKLETARQAWRQHARRHWRSRDPLPSTSLSGALLAFRRDTWDAIGPFDEGFRLYYEENDWLLRAAHAGRQPFYVPAAEAIHLHNPSAGQSAERRAWESESFLRFGARHYGSRFMKRLLLLARRGESVIPEWSTVPDVVHGADLWIEVSPSAFGFPAATTRMNGSPFPSMRGLELGHRALYFQIVDDDGRELSRYTTMS